MSYELRMRKPLTAAIGMVLLLVGLSAAPVAADSGWSSRGIPLQGQVLFGTSVMGEVEPFESLVGGRMGIRRSYFSAGQVSGAVNRVKSDQAAGRVPWVSFTLPYSWSKMASGAGDAWARDLAARLGATDGPVWVAFHHEPEGDGALTDWVAMQRRLSPILRAQKNIAFTIILMGWQQFFSGNAAYSMDALWPGKQYVDVLGFDPYNWYATSRSNGTKGWDWAELNDYYVKINAWRSASGNMDVPFAIAETGYNDVAASVPQNFVSPKGKTISTRGPGSQWLARAYDDMKAAGGIALAYFNVSASVNNEPSDWSWPITAEPKIKVFAQTLARSDRYGTVTPSPNPTVPGAPGAVSALARSGAVRVSWSPPASDGGRSVTGYSARVFSSAIGGAAVRSCESALTSCEVSGLAAGGTYFVDVVARNAVGTSAASSPRVSVTLPTAQGSVSFRAASTISGNFTSSRVPVPSGVRAGDVMLMFVSTNTNSSVATPAGWTLLGERMRSDFGTRLFSRVVSSSDVGGSVPVSLGKISKTDVTVLAYQNAVASVKWSAALESTSSNVHTAPAVASDDVNGRVVHFWVDKASSSRTWTLPSGLTRRSLISDSGSGSLASLSADLNGVGSGAARSATSGTSTSKATMWSVALSSQ